MPILAAVNAIPTVAFAPVAIVWFGMGSVGKIVLVSYIAGFTLLLHTLQGLKACDAATIDLLRSFGASTTTIYLKLQLPSALPSMFAGFRIATVRSVIIAIVAEMLGAYEGLGWIIYRSANELAYARLWGAVIVAALVGILLSTLVASVEKRVIWWHESQQAEGRR